jgi:hypothetical protein
MYQSINLTISITYTIHHYLLSIAIIKHHKIVYYLRLFIEGLKGSVIQSSEVPAMHSRSLPEAGVGMNFYKV